MDELQRAVWDAIVLGAGPAGAASAYLLAKRGWRVLLLERSSWPREKVCGGCLSESAVQCVREIGLASILNIATPITSSHLYRARSKVILPVREAYAIARNKLDAAIVDAFVALGGTFVTGASASLQPIDTRLEYRIVRASIESQPMEVRGRVVLACDGLAGSSVNGEPWSKWTIAPDAYIGVAATLDAGALPIHPGEIHMHIGTGGYAGAVRYASGEIHLAAALDAKQCRALNGPASLIESIFASCDRPIRAESLKLKGAPTLTRHREHLGGHRVLAVGDACGYVEPFTGEGVAWALRSAMDVTSMITGEWADKMPTCWRSVQRHSLGQKQSICRAVRYAVRRPLLASAAINVLQYVPSLSRLVTSAGKVRS